MWDDFLDLLDSLIEIEAFWPRKSTFQDAENPFLGCLGCFFHMLGIIFFVFSVIGLIIKLVDIIFV
jgi:hypothetical protein